MAETQTPVAPPEEARNAIADALDKWSGTQTKTPPEPAKEPATPIAPPPEPPKELPPTPPPEPKRDGLKLPSFITEEGKSEAPVLPPVEEFPSEPPEGVKGDPKKEEVWGKWREKWDQNKKETDRLNKRVVELEAKGKEPDPAITQKLQELERRNQELEVHYQSASLENNPDFINSVLQPLSASYLEAKRIIRDGGGDEAAFDKALMLGGKAHYDALDEVLRELPESAKGELNSTMREYRRLATQRAEAHANAPKIAQELQRKAQERELQMLSSTQEKLGKTFDDIVRYAKEDYGLELLRETDDPDIKWWNEIGPSILQEAKKSYLNTHFDDAGMKKVAFEKILAHSAPTLRDLWLRAEKRASTAEKELSELRSSEPTIGSGGGAPSLNAKEEDLKRPVGEVFLDALKNKPWEKK